MTLIGIKFGIQDRQYLKEIASEIKCNSEKQVAKLLFDVKVYCIESDILVINKIFVATQSMNLLYLILLVGTSIPWFVWGVSLPFMIVFSLFLLWSFMNTPLFNFLMFRIMIRKQGYKGRLVML